MNVVIDTNVIVSALISPYGDCAKIVRLVLAGKMKLWIDARIFVEYREVLHRQKFNIDRSKVDIFLEDLYEMAGKTSAPPHVSSLPDPDDAIFYAVAVAARADYLITGNKKHFPKNICNKIDIVSPKEFLDLPNQF